MSSPSLCIGYLSMLFKTLTKYLPGAESIGTKFWFDLSELSLGSNSNPIIWEDETDWKSSKAAKKALKSTILWGNVKVTTTCQEVWELKFFNYVMWHFFNAIKEKAWVHKRNRCRQNNNMIWPNPHSAWSTYWF